MKLEYTGDSDLFSILLRVDSHENLHWRMATNTKQGWCGNGWSTCMLMNFVPYKVTKSQKFESFMFICVTSVHA